MKFLKKNYFSQFNLRYKNDYFQLKFIDKKHKIKNLLIINDCYFVISGTILIYKLK